MKHSLSLTFLFSSFVLAGPALAQVPYGSLVVSESGGADGFVIVDPATGYVTPIEEPNGNFLGGALTVSIDAATGNSLITSAGFSIGGPPLLEVPLDANFYDVNAVNGQALPLFGALERAHSVPGRILVTISTVQSGVWSLPTTTGTAQQLLSAANLRDVAVIGNVAYACTYASSSNVSAIWTIDLGTGVLTTLGASYPQLRSICAVNGVLFAGRADGEISVVDIGTGAMSPFLVTGLGSIEAMAAASAGAIYFATAGNEVYDTSNLAAPVYVSPNTITDIDVAVTDQPTRLVSGSGCAGAGAQPELALTPPPALGTNWSVAMTGGAPGAISGAVLGFDRADLDLTFLGLPGCRLVADFQLIVTAVTSPAGDANVLVAIPNSPSVVGARLNGQFFVLEAGGAIALTRGVEAHVR